MGLRKPRKRGGNRECKVRELWTSLPPRVLYVFKRFLSCSEWESHFVILLSNQNGWSSTKMQLVRCNLSKTRHWWVALCNKIRESDFFFFFWGLLWLGFRKFSLKNSDKNKTEKEYVSKLEFQKSNHYLVCPISSPEPLDFIWPRAETTGTGDMNGSCTRFSVLKLKSIRTCKFFVSSPLHIWKTYVPR